MMKAALEEYNKNNGGTSHLQYVNQSATMPPLKSPDKMDVGNLVKDTRRRGATVIGTRDYQQLQPHIHQPQHPLIDDIGGASGVQSIKEDENYNTLKMRYLRSLNISITSPQATGNNKDQQVSASAPIPIPIPMKQTDSDDEDNSDTENDDESSFDFGNGTVASSVMMGSTYSAGIHYHLGGTNKLIYDNISNDNLANGSGLVYHNSNNNNSNSNNSNSDNATPEVTPIRKDSKAKNHKFIPPHEMMGNGESLMNHSLPGTRKVFGQ